jgi:hypothetical protein
MLHMCLHTSQFVSGQSAVLCTSNRYVQTEIRTKAMKNVRQAICYTTGTYYFIKVEVALVHDLKEYRGGEGIATTTTDVGTRRRCVVSLTLQQLLLRQTRPRYPLNKGMGGLPRTGLDVLFSISFIWGWAKHRPPWIKNWLGLCTGIWKYDPCI